MSASLTTRILAAGLFACLAVFQNANASVLNQGVLDDIYSQASFGNAPIDLRFMAPREIVNSGLVDINITFDFNNPFAPTELDDLFALGNAAPNINVFFVGSIQSIFGPLAGIAQLLPDGSRGNNVAVLDSLTFALDEIVAHEIAHALGLDHETGTTNPFQPPDPNVPNLMSVFANGNTDLNAEQVATIFNSPFVQGNAADGFFIDVQLINIVASTSTVSVPASLPFPLLGFAVVALVACRKAVLSKPYSR